MDIRRIPLSPDRINAVAWGLYYLRMLSVAGRYCVMTYTDEALYQLRQSEAYKGKVKNLLRRYHDAVRLWEYRLTNPPEGAYCLFSPMSSEIVMEQGWHDGAKTSDKVEFQKIIGGQMYQHLSGLFGVLENKMRKHAHLFSFGNDAVSVRFATAVLLMESLDYAITETMQGAAKEVCFDLFRKFLRPADFSQCLSLLKSAFCEFLHVDEGKTIDVYSQHNVHISVEQILENLVDPTFLLKCESEAIGDADTELFRSHRKVRQLMEQNAEISSAIEDMRRKVRLERYGK